MDEDKKANISFWIKLIIAILTGIGSALATTSCMSAAGMHGLISML